MKKIIIKILIVLILLLPIVIYGYYGYFDYRKNQKINPTIFPSFIKIENHCLEYIEQKQVEPDEYERCSKLIKKWENDLNPNVDGYSAEEWYKIIQQLQFDQPDLYLTQPATKQEYDQAMDEQKRLKEIQSIIIEKQFNESMIETKKLIEDLQNNQYE